MRPRLRGSRRAAPKNTLDWVSREWQGRGASAPGAQHAGGEVLPGQFSLAHADTAFDVEGSTLMLKSPARLLHALVLEPVNGAGQHHRRTETGMKKTPVTRRLISFGNV